MAGRGGATNQMPSTHVFLFLHENYDWGWHLLIKNCQTTTHQVIALSGSVENFCHLFRYGHSSILGVPLDN